MAFEYAFPGALAPDPLPLAGIEQGRRRDPRQAGADAGGTRRHFQGSRPWSPRRPPGNEESRGLFLGRPGSVRRGGSRLRALHYAVLGPRSAGGGCRFVEGPQARRPRSQGAFSEQSPMVAAATTQKPRKGRAHVSRGSVTATAGRRHFLRQHWKQLHAVHERRARGIQPDGPGT